MISRPPPLGRCQTTLLDDGRRTRDLLADRKLEMPVLTVAAGLHAPDADPAAVLRPHATDVTGRAAPTGHFVAEEAPRWLVETVEEFSRRAAPR